MYDDDRYFELHRCVSDPFDDSDDDHDAAYAYMMQRRNLGIIIHEQEHREVRHRRYISRDREKHANRLMHDYFEDNCVYIDAQFKTHFRMKRDLFNRLVTELVTADSFFTQRYDARGIPGHTPHQKLVSALRVLAYGVLCDATDEYVCMAKTTSYKNLKRFCTTIIQHFGPRYLRSPTTEDVRRLLQENERRGFPGMLGSIDCMHWKWKNCPTQWQRHLRGHSDGPTLILEAVASYDLWFWHAFFGTPEACNDLNVLYRSHVFDQFLLGKASTANFTLNGNQYEMGYYLTDGIYPKLATIVQSFRVAETLKQLKFNEQQKAKRKDVERAFGVLQAKFAIVAGPVKYWEKDDTDLIMKTCIILYNMIIEDERRDRNWQHQYDGVQITRGVGIGHFSSRHAAMRDKKQYIRLREDLMEHIWEQHGRGVDVHQ